MTESASFAPFHTTYATNGMIYFFTVSRHADENGEETGKCKRVDANKQGIEDFLFTLWITRSHFHCVVSCRHTSTKNRTDFDKPTFFFVFVHISFDVCNSICRSGVPQCDAACSINSNALPLLRGNNINSPRRKEARGAGRP